MFKKLICLYFIIFPGFLWADGCLKYKQIPSTKILKTSYETHLVQPEEYMDKYHGNVVATLTEDYDVIVDVISVNNGYCVVLKGIDAKIGYSDFLVKIDKSNKYNSCEYNAILNHEYKHLGAYLSVIDDLEYDIKDSVFNAANSIMPEFVTSREDIDGIIEKMNYKLREHPELILLKQKIRAAQEIRNKRIDQNETGENLKKC